MINIPTLYSIRHKKGSLAYTPPLDLVAGGAAAYSLRVVRAAYTGPLIKIQRSSDNAQLDIYAYANGSLDTYSVVNFANGGDASVVILYDQSGNARHLTNFYIYGQPKIVVTGVLQIYNSKPCMVFSGNEVLGLGVNSNFLSSGFTNFNAVRIEGFTQNSTMLTCAQNEDVGFDSPSYNEYGYPFSYANLNYKIGASNLPNGYGGPYPQESTFYSSRKIGYAIGKLNNSTQICRDSSNNIYVVNFTNYRRIEKYNSSGTPIASFEIPFGTGSGEAYFIGGIGVQPNGNIIVADNVNHKILVYNSSFTFLGQYGSYGSGTNQFNYPSQIGVTASGDFYIADGYNYRIVKYSGATYTQTAAFGTNGTGNGQFSYVLGVAVDSSGNVFVADSGNNRIQKFNSSHVYQTKIGSTGTDNGQFINPINLAIDSSNNVFVLENGSNRRIQKFTNSLVYSSQFGSNAQFNSPYGLCIDSSNNIYVSDFNLNKFTKYNSSFVYQGQFGINHYEDIANYSCGCDSSAKAFEAKYNGTTIASGTSLYYLTSPYAQLLFGQTLEGNGTNFVGKLFESLTFNSKLNSTNWSAVDSNIQNYWGIS